MCVLVILGRVQERVAWLVPYIVLKLFVVALLVEGVASGLRGVEVDVLYGLLRQWGSSVSISIRSAGKGGRGGGRGRGRCRGFGLVLWQNLAEAVTDGEGDVIRGPAPPTLSSLPPIQLAGPPLTM